MLVVPSSWSLTYQDPSMLSTTSRSRCELKLSTRYENEFGGSTVSSSSSLVEPSSEVFVRRTPGVFQPVVTLLATIAGECPNLGKMWLRSTSMTYSKTWPMGALMVRVTRTKSSPTSVQSRSTPIAASRPFRPGPASPR